MGRKNVCVIVLGDIGRSPRVQYHAISLAEEGHIVDIVGYGGAKPVEALTNQPLVSFHYLNPVPNLPLPRILNYAFKTIWQAISLLFVLLIIRKADYMLVQNPPAIPTMVVCYLHKLIFKAKLIIDWHNYAHSIMALQLGRANKLVKISHYIEETFGRKADNNFCVTKAMQADLHRNWGIDAITLYDRPPEIFHSISLLDKHELLSALGMKYELLLSGSNTVFTEIDESGNVKLKETRPGILVSTTSWTEDEDFSILFSALKDYENSWSDGNQRNLPDLICVITGKGPLKEYYIGKTEREDWKHVQIITPWLEPKDYPLLIACADLGVSLHTSSSGLDLPMKVVDMFGTGLPVCAYNYESLNELVKHDENGYVFNTSDELASQIMNWFDNFPNNLTQQSTEERFKKELRSFQNLRWKQNWKNVAAPIFK